MLGCASVCMCVCGRGGFQGSDYRVFQDRVHFFDPFEELMEVVEERLQALEEEDKGR